MHKITRMLIVLATLTPVTGFAQTAQQFSVNQSGNRVLAFEVIPTLRAKTGWKISMEEPIWPPVASAVNPGMTRQGEKITNPPAERVALPPVSLLGSSAPAAVIDTLLKVYNAQNSFVSYKRSMYGDMVVIEPESLADSAGRKQPTQSAMSVPIEVPVEQRLPEQHLDAIAEAISRQVNVRVVFDTTGFGYYFGRAYTGLNNPDPTEAFKSSWGTKGPVSARKALLNFLEGSKTTTVWSMLCTVGVGASPGPCRITIFPMTVEVKDQSGKIITRSMYYDRGPSRYGNPLPTPPRGR